MGNRNSPVNDLAAFLTRQMPGCSVLLSLGSSEMFRDILPAIRLIDMPDSRRSRSQTRQARRARPGGTSIGPCSMPRASIAPAIGNYDPALYSGRLPRIGEGPEHAVGDDRRGRSLASIGLRRFRRIGSQPLRDRSVWL